MTAIDVPESVRDGLAQIAAMMGRQRGTVVTLGDVVERLLRAYGPEVPSRAFNWPVECNTSADWDRNTTTEFLCGHSELKSRPDGRCKSGTRFWQEPCHHAFPEWGTPGELLQAVAAHIAEAHP